MSGQAGSGPKLKPGGIILVIVAVAIPVVLFAGFRNYDRTHGIKPRESVIAASAVLPPTPVSGLEGSVSKSRKPDKFPCDLILGPGEEAMLCLPDGRINFDIPKTPPGFSMKFLRRTYYRRGELGPDETTADPRTGDGVTLDYTPKWVRVENLNSMKVVMYWYQNE